MLIVKALHVHDNNGLNDQHMCPLFGTLDAYSLMSGLKKIGYDGYFTFEACNFFAPSAFNNSDLQNGFELKLKAEGILYDIGEKFLGEYLKSF